MYIQKGVRRALSMFARFFMPEIYFSGSAVGRLGDLRVASFPFWGGMPILSVRPPVDLAFDSGRKSLQKGV